MDIAISDSHILHQGTVKREGWTPVLTLVEPFEKQIRVGLRFERGSEIWAPEDLKMPFLVAYHLPRSHRNQRLNKLFKSCRKDDSLLCASPEFLAKWFMEDFRIFAYHFRFSVHQDGPAYSLTMSIGDSYHGVWHGKPGDTHAVFDSLSKKTQAA